MAVKRVKKVEAGEKVLDASPNVNFVIGARAKPLELEPPLSVSVSVWRGTSF